MYKINEKPRSTNLFEPPSAATGTSPLCASKSEGSPRPQITGRRQVPFQSNPHTSLRSSPSIYAVPPGAAVDISDSACGSNPFR